MRAYYTLIWELTVNFKSSYIVGLIADWLRKEFPGTSPLVLKKWASQIYKSVQGLVVKELDVDMMLIGTSFDADAWLVEQMSNVEVDSRSVDVCEFIVKYSKDPVLLDFKSSVVDGFKQSVDRHVMKAVAL